MSTFNPLIKDKIATQDKNLELLEQGLDRLHGVAKNINSELNEQHIMLNELDDDLTKSNTEIETINKKVNRLIEKVKKDGCGIYFVIGFLVLIIILLLFLIVFL